jgi:fumarylpyruvate hydrolase
VPEIIVELSQLYRLMPGDLIFTGTPAGVGPLVPGDEVQGGVELLGTLSFTVVP